MSVDTDNTALMGNYARYPVTFESARGCTLVDTDGREYLDMLAGIAVLSTGHCHPHVVAAVKAQAERLMHVSNLFYTEQNVRLAERLSRRSLGGKVYFANSGAEANEAAIKLARKRRRGGTFLVADGGFHGRTYGALSATAQESKQAPFAPLVPGFRALPVDQLPDALSGEVAAVLIEPVQGESGVHPIDVGVLGRIRAACDAHGALLIFDEVQTGVGRTGTLWAYEQLGVRPDVLTFAKGIGGGFPIGGLVTTPELADVLAPGDHGSTFAGSPLASAAANAVLDVVDDAGFLTGVRERGVRLRARLAELPAVEAVRGLGLMVGAELRGNAPEVVDRALNEQRLVLNATGPATLRFVPPLVITDAEVDTAVERLRALL